MKRILLICCLILSFLSCEDNLENHPVPSFPVYLDLDLMTPRAKDLRIPPSSCIYTIDNIIKGKEFIGFGGVLVVNTMVGGYKAFDLSCPNEAKNNILVEVKDDHNAVCPVCGSIFEIINFGSGNCIEGKSKYPLRPYQVVQNGKDKLVVRNNR